MAWLATSGLANDPTVGPASAGTWPKRVHLVRLGSVQIAVTGAEMRAIRIDGPVVRIP